MLLKPYKYTSIWTKKERDPHAQSRRHTIDLAASPRVPGCARVCPDVPTWAGPSSPDLTLFLTRQCSGWHSLAKQTPSNYSYFYSEAVSELLGAPKNHGDDRYLRVGEGLRQLIVIEILR